MLREKYGSQIMGKPSILCHHNPYNVLEKDWSGYTANVVNNKTINKLLPKANYIPLAIDFDLFPFNKDYTDNTNVIMVANRIEGSKGIEPVARVCAELGYRLTLVGSISDPSYFSNVMTLGNVDFMQDISDEELLNAYRNSAIHVCNSKDNFESGTLPILEAMAVGVPVLTRNIGHVPDLNNEKNMLVRDGQPDDTDELKALLKGLMDDRERRLAMRDEAWHTVRNYTSPRRARMYSQLYYKTFYKNPLVSVVMPVYGHHDSLQKTINALDEQTYPALELVIVSDGDPEFDDLKIESKHTLKYLRVGEFERYGLGLARDSGVLEAEGEIVMFLDQRFLPDKNAVEIFVKNLTPKKWLYGNKNQKRNFVENFSCIYRQDFIDMGMSNQLITGYGGMSQELRERAKRQGIKMVFIEDALAVAQYASHNYNGRKDDIYRMKEILYKLNLSQ